MLSFIRLFEKVVVVVVEEEEEEEYLLLQSVYQKI